MRRTTLHNHRWIDSAEKPLILNLQFKEACERIKAGEKGVKEEMESKFSLVEAQVNLMKQLIEKHQ